MTKIQLLDPFDFNFAEGAFRYIHEFLFIYDYFCEKQLEEDISISEFIFKYCRLHFTVWFHVEYLGFSESLYDDWQNGRIDFYEFEPSM